MRNLDRFFFKNEASKATYLSYSFVSGFRDMMMQFISLFLLLYVQFGSPLSQVSDVSYYTELYTIITISFVIIKLIIGLLSPLVSFIIDNSHFKIGKYKVYVLSGAVLTTTFFLLMFFQGGSGLTFVIFFLIFTFFHELTYLFNDIAFWGYLPSLTKNEKKRAKIVSLMNTSIAIGTYTVASLSPLVNTGDSKRNLTIMALVIAILFVVTQCLFSLFFMKENISDQENKKKTMSLKQTYGIIKDKEVLISIISFSTIFIAQFTMMANSVNYFYYNYGYGSFESTPLNGALLSGGGMSFIFTLIYGVGYTLAMITLPLLLKRFRKKVILFISLIVIVVGYLIFYFIGLNKGQEITLFITSLITFYFQGLVYVIYILNCANVTETYLVKYKLDPSSSIAGYKCMMVKIANALQALFQTIFLSLSSLITLSNGISSIEAQFNIGQISDIEKNQNITNLITSFEGISQSLELYKIGITLVPLAFLVLGLLLAIFSLKVLDEKYYQEVTQVLKDEQII